MENFNIFLLSTLNGNLEHLQTYEHLIYDSNKTV